MRNIISLLCLLLVLRVWFTIPCGWKECKASGIVIGTDNYGLWIRNDVNHLILHMDHPEYNITDSKYVEINAD